MVFPFALPTTAHVSFQPFLTSSTHPSLPQAATTARHALRQALKTHKRLPRGPQQDAQLPTLLSLLTEYLPYLFALSHGLSGKPIEQNPAPSSPAAKPDTEEVEITLLSELEPAWRPSLSSPSSSGLSALVFHGHKDGRRTIRRPASYIHGIGLDFEIAFTLSTLAYVLSRLARSLVLRTLYASATPTADQRAAAVQAATKHLLQASAVHTLLASSPAFAAAAITATATGATGKRSPGSDKAPLMVVSELDPAVQAGLASLALAEATLLAVLKDDAYLVACIQARNPNDKEWMVRAPEIPKVRALLFARLCVRAAEYAEQAAAGIGAVATRGAGKSGAIDEQLVGYVRALARVARARACRFFGVDAELAGKVGDGIAWLRAAKGALGLRRTGVEEESREGTTAANRAKGTLSKLKHGWSARREEKMMEKDAGKKKGREEAAGLLDAGDNAGWEEEGRVIDMLETKWVKMNDTINTQLVPPSTNLLASLPSGRDIHSAPAPYKPPALHEDQLVRMRAPPDDDDDGLKELSDQDDSEDDAAAIPSAYQSERGDSAYF